MTEEKSTSQPSNFFASIGQPLKGLALSFSRQILFIIPLMLILPLFMGVDGIMFAGPISDFVACVIAVLFIIHQFKKMSIKEESIN